ncbi:MAG: hypothetical protein WCD18_12655, partial [Thermosynechococcaceae cyanobacterium]
MTSHTEVGTSRQFSGMSDETLIQSFLQGFFQGSVLLLSNQHLRTEPLFDSMQLLSSKDGVIATAKAKATPIGMVVRQGSPYTELLHQGLIEQQFYPLSKTAPEGCYLYRFCDVPEGYTLHCTTAKELWRACWGRGSGMRSGIPLDLLIWRKGPAGAKETWYSLRGMDCDKAQLLVKLLGWTDLVESSDLMVWAKHTATKLGHSTSTRKPG